MNGTTEENSTAALVILGSTAGWLAAFGIEALVIISLNVLTLIVLIRTRSLRKRTTYFLINLAITDLLVGMAPLTMYMSFITDPGMFSTNKSLRSTYQAMDMIFGACSIWTLAVISLERLCIVMIPRHHRAARDNHYFSAIAISWVIPTVICVLGFLTSSGLITRSVYLNITVVSLLFIPTTLVVMSHLFLWIIFKHRNVGSQRARQEKELSKTLFIITGAFLFTCLPFQVLVFYMALFPAVNPPLRIVLALKLLQYGNSFMNPIIYWPRLPGFKDAVRKFFGFQVNPVLVKYSMTRGTMKSLRSSRLIKFNQDV